jgi:hypothetical protein
MLYEALAILKAQLQQYISQNDDTVTTDSEVVLGNIALAESQVSADINNKVVIGLVSLENDATLKNGPTRFVEQNQIRKENRPVHTNAHIIITAHYPQSYTNAVKRLSQVIKFFQGKSIFTQANSPLTELEEVEGIAEFKMVLELMSPSFEQQNHIWGMLGGKSHPFALYKARMIMLKRDAPMDYETPIKHIIIND